MLVHRSGQRYHSVHDGIETWHAFSAGAHYDPANVSFGSLVGVDEHHLAPGAGFARHAHRGVEIVSHVLAGTLRHEDGDGVRLVHAGEFVRQVAGGGIEHAESNASGTEPLVLLQLTFRSPADADVAVRTAPVTVRGPGYLQVLSGSVRIGGRRLEPGDSVRSGSPVTVTGDGSCLAVELG